MASAAESRAHLCRNRPRPGDGPTTPDHAGKQCLPSLGGLVREDDGANAVRMQDAAAFGKRRGHRLLEPLTILGTTVDLLGFVLHRFGSLG